MTSVFPPALISPSISESLPEGYTIRPLARDDYTKGFLECLQTLTATGAITETQFHEQYDWMRENGQEWYYGVVIEYAGRVVGTGALIVERKFIHYLGKAGHIALDSIAVNVSCYKTILNCGPKNQRFYEKCGYSGGGVEMSQYFEEAPSEYERG